MPSPLQKYINKQTRLDQAYEDAKKATQVELALRPPGIHYSLARVANNGYIYCTSNALTAQQAREIGEWLLYITYDPDAEKKEVSNG